MYHRLTRRQVIAWEDKATATTTTTPSRNGNTAVWRYGVVVTGGGEGDLIGNEGLEGDDTLTLTSADGGRGSGRVCVGQGEGKGLRHVRVKLTPGKVDTLLSSQVCAAMVSMSMSNVVVVVHGEAGTRRKGSRGLPIGRN